MTSATLESLHLYPVKALAGTAVEELAVEPWGPAADRRWMLTAPDGGQLTQREHPRLALARAVPLPVAPGETAGTEGAQGTRGAEGTQGAQGAGGIRVTAPGREPLDIAVPPADEGTVPVRLFTHKIDAVPASAAADEWFSAYLGTPVRLVHMDAPEHRRPLDPKFAREGEGETVTFADGFPVLLTSVSSLDDLNSLIARGDHPGEGPLPMDRFRPGFVVTGSAPWAEEEWRRLRIGEAVFRVASSCGRCVVTTVDQATGLRGKEPLRTLARHRRSGDQLVFGRNLVPERTGRVRSGDLVEVLA